MKTVMLFNVTGSSMIQLAVFAIQASDLKAQVIQGTNINNFLNHRIKTKRVKQEKTLKTMGTNCSSSSTHTPVNNKMNKIAQIARYWPTRG